MPILIWSLLLTFAAALPAAAQTFSVDDTEAHRAGFIVGYAGNGADIQAALESRLLWDRVRFRAALGHGRWDDAFLEHRTRVPPPRVTRLALSLLRFTEPDRQVPVRGYVGGGFTVLMPHGFGAQTGLHGVAGVEHMGEHWAIGPEVAIELPYYDRRLGFGPAGSGAPLWPAARLSIAVRRRF